MDIVIIASEAVPFAKTGGLADVAGSLPPALERLGHRVVLIIPCYRRSRSAGVAVEPTGLTLRVPVGSSMVEGQLLRARLPGTHVAVYLIDQPAFFDREGIYQSNGVDYADNCARFVFFDRAALEAVRLLELRPDVLHCNDWQTGLIPVYLDEFYRQQRPSFETLGTLLTIHNMAYQGQFWHGDMALTGLDSRLFNWRQLEFHGRLNLLKAGLVFADFLNTVSPTYSREIQTPEFGCGLHDLLHDRCTDLRGIVNGIDPLVWNPATDVQIFQHYDASSVTAGKAACKAYLQRRTGLSERPDTPVFAQIGRLDPQKGWDLLGPVVDDLLSGDVQLVVLGVGQQRYHEMLDRLAERHPGKLRVFLDFLPPLAHQIEAGADLFLLPSLYEPCGLNQLYSQAYGTLPLVRATGGLADTVIAADERTLADGTATGFAFRDATPEALQGAIKQALAIWRDRPAWSRMIQAGMRADWSWDRSARAYAQLYEEVRSRRHARAAAG